VSDFEQLPDCGRLMAAQSKKHEKSPDYWGEIAIDPKNMVRVRVEKGLHIYKINGWKKKSRTGTTYLSLAVDRWIPPEEEQNNRSTVEDDSDIPF
jgi:hypothetical protein